MSNDPLDEPMNWGPEEPGPTPREYAEQSEKMWANMPDFGVAERPEKLEDGLIASFGPLVLSDQSELSAILEEVRMIRRALEKTPLFIVVPVSGDVDVQAVADALEQLHADVTAHMHQEAATNETSPGSELPE